MEHKKDIALLLAAAIMWGFSFPALKYALSAYDTFPIIAFRFTIASVLLAIPVVLARHRITRREMTLGIAAGVILFYSFATQVYGQITISPATSAFITGLYIVIVPIGGALLGKKMPANKIAFCVLLAVLGLWLLTGASFSLGIGEILTLLSAVGFAAHILLLSRSSECDSNAFTLVQMAVAGALSWIALPFAGGLPRTYPFEPLLAILYLGIFASALAYWFQTIAQKRVAPSSTALIFICEPVFAAISSVFFFQEYLSPLKLIGGGIILFAMYLSQR
ncbi:MAG: DMT family transporter [Candidatus ainarchaeum sp.]|nr:DMT family transporter [Candidatus ainarchaeum sp.]